MTENITQDDIMTTEECAVIAKMGVASMARLITVGAVDGIPRGNPGRRGHRVMRSAFETWLKSGMPVGPAPSPSPKAPPAKAKRAKAKAKKKKAAMR